MENQNLMLDEKISLLKAADIAKKLNISRSLAYQLMQAGEISTIRIGRAVRVLPEDLDEYIQKCRIVGNHQDTQ